MSKIDISRAQENVQVKRSGILDLFAAVSRDYAILYALILLIICMYLFQPLFLTGENVLDMIRQASVIAIIAAGEFFVMLTGGIDISVGSTVALSGITYAMLVRDGIMSMPLAAIVALIAGVLVGWINGVLASYCRIPPFIATLGTMSAVRGIVYVVTNCYPITGLPEGFKDIGRSFVIGLPLPAVIMFVVFVIVAIVLGNMRFGRYLYAIGGNQEASYLSGIKVNRHLMMSYVVCGLLAAFSGIILASRLDAGQATAGIGYEFQAITATVIGGASLSGGKGKAMGVFFGGIFIAALSNGMTLLNVNSYVQQIITGCVLVLAVGIDVLRNTEKH